VIARHLASAARLTCGLNVRAAGSIVRLSLVNLETDDAWIAAE
jgi:hypothetical protein